MGFSMPKVSVSAPKVSMPKLPSVSTSSVLNNHPIFGGGFVGNAVSNHPILGNLPINSRNPFKSAINNAGGGGGGGAAPGGGQAIDMFNKFAPTYDSPLTKGADGSFQMNEAFKYSPEKLGYQDLNPIFNKQKNEMDRDLRGSLATANNQMLLQGGTDAGAIERMAGRNMNARRDAFGELAETQSAMESEMKQRVDEYNNRNTNDASRYNIDNLFGENQRKHGFEFDKFNTLMNTYGSEQTARSMEGAANQGGGIFPGLPGLPGMGGQGIPGLPGFSLPFGPTTALGPIDPTKIFGLR